MLKKTKHAYTFGRFSLNVTDRVLLFDGREIKLEPRAFDVLVFFVSHAGDLVNRDEIKLYVWGTSFLEDNNVDQRIAIVRRVLRQHDRSHEYIHNSRGYGWRFVAEVTCFQNNPPQEPLPASAAPSKTESAVSSRVPGRQSSRRWIVIGALAVVMIVSAVLLSARRSPTPNFQPLQFEILRLTTDGKTKNGPWSATGVTFTSPKDRPTP